MEKERTCVFSPSPLQELSERCCPSVQKPEEVVEVSSMSPHLLQVDQAPWFAEAVVQWLRSRELVTCSARWPLLWPWPPSARFVVLRSRSEWDLAHALPRDLRALRLLQEEPEKLRERLTTALKEAERHRLWLSRQRQRLVMVSSLRLRCWWELLESLSQLPMMRELL